LHLQDQRTLNQQKKKHNVIINDFSYNELIWLSNNRDIILTNHNVNEMKNITLIKTMIKQN